MEQKILFIKMWQSGNYTMTSLCDRFNISRTTGHKLVKRFEEEGESCLKINSTMPHTIPNKTPKKVENAIIKLKNSTAEEPANSLH